jgi:hypothetical protein
MAQMGADIRGDTTSRSTAEPQPKELNKLHGLPELHGVPEYAQAARTLMDSGAKGAETWLPRNTLNTRKATLAHRMGEGLGVRACGSDICVYPRNLRSTPHLTADGADGRRYQRGHDLTHAKVAKGAKTWLPRNTLNTRKATLAHRMGEGLGVRASGSDICVIHAKLLCLSSTAFANRLR